MNTKAESHEGETGTETLDEDAVRRAAPDRSQSHLETAVRIAVVGLFVLSLLYTIFFAGDFLIPVTVAFFLKILLTPLVRQLRKWVPEAAGAAIVILFTVLIAIGVVYELSGPANDWVARAPNILRQAESKLRHLKESMQNVSRAAEEVEKIADVDGEPDARAVAVRGLRKTT